LRASSAAWPAITDGILLAAEAAASDRLHHADALLGQPNSAISAFTT